MPEAVFEFDFVQMAIFNTGLNIFLVNFGVIFVGFFFGFDYLQPILDSFILWWHSLSGFVKTAALMDDTVPYIM